MLSSVNNSAFSHATSRSEDLRRHRERIMVVGRADRPHLRVLAIERAERAMIIAVVNGDAFEVKCRVRFDIISGYSIVDVEELVCGDRVRRARRLVRRLLTADRFADLVGLEHPTSPVDSLRCGVAVGGCTFSIHEFEGGEFVAVYFDGGNSTKSLATRDDWNDLVDAWNAAEARYGDAERVRVAELFFKIRGWMPATTRIF